MRNQAMNCNCASMQIATEKATSRQQCRNRVKRCNNTATTMWKNNNKLGNACNKINNKLLITTLLLITMTTATICQTEALSMPTIRRANVATAAAAMRAMQLSALTALLRTTQTTALTLSNVGAAYASLVLSPPTQQQQQQQQQYDNQQQQQQQQQRRQLQQQQLFELLTKNRQASPSAGAAAAAAPTTTLRSTIPSAASASGMHNSNNYMDLTSGNSRRHNIVAIVDDDDDDADHDNHYAAGKLGFAMSAAASSLEITGFVADDGQQYEKAERALTDATAPNTVSCPKECKCLNDYFDCGKQLLDHVPELPNYVQILDLVGNILNDSTVLQIQNLPELHKLSLKRNELENIPIFTGLPALKQLNLANNGIQRVTSEALAALPKLKKLDLSKNYLHTLAAQSFPSRSRLAHLILNANQIASIDENAFATLGDLIDLELNNNRLYTLPAGVFRNLNKLKKLSLNANHLEINWSTFKGLHALQKLHLKSNNIRALQDGVFHVMRAIETIELDNNSITSLSRQGLFNLTKLHFLSLSNNSISRIEPDTWEFTQSLYELDLSHNNISEFKPQHLDCLQRLRVLNLGYNKLQYLSDTTFDCVKNLEELNLRRNQLAWIIEDQGAAPPFKALRKLKRLDLYGNNLKQINTKSLSGLTSLETLNLGGNTLATIQHAAFDHMQQLQKLTFKSSNFICDCELLWFRRWLQRSTQAHAHAPKKEATAECGFPEHLLDRSLLSLTLAELACADSPKPLITQEPTDQLAVKGANITMECIANSPAAAFVAASDELKIVWRHDNHNVRERLSQQSGYSYATTETQVHHDQSTNQTTMFGYLRLFNVSYESAGRYQCVVSNAFGTTYSQKFKISIGIHPTFLQIPSNLTIDAGDTARLVCSATGDPVPEIALQKFGATDFPAATERRLQVLRAENAFIITNAKPIDAGIYTCTAESAAGEIKINASLVVNDKPQPTIPVVSKEVTLGASSIIECLNDATADLQQPQQREWYKDNKPFHAESITASERHYFTAEKELLVIVNTQSIDAGHYRCEITDNLKTYSMITNLVVVQANLSQNTLIIMVFCVTLGCLFVGTCVVWCLLCIQRRKSYARPRHFDGIAHVGGNANQMQQHTLNGSTHCNNELEQTQLTTLNRTYLQRTSAQQAQTQLQQQQQQQQQQPPQQQQRPRSLADFEFKMNGSAVLCTTPASGSSASAAAARTPISAYATYNPADSNRYYMQRHNSLNAHEHLEQQQDQLSSKDSGTGSDAAVKRSIDDFTIMAAQEQLQQCAHTSTPAQYDKRTKRASLAKADTYDDDDEPDLLYAATHALGISTYDIELLPEYNSSSEPDERAHFLMHNNHNDDNDNNPHERHPPRPHSVINFDGGGSGGSDLAVGGAVAGDTTPHTKRTLLSPTTRATTPPPPPLPAKKPNINLSTNFNAYAATKTQAVDI